MNADQNLFYCGKGVIEGPGVPLSFVSKRMGFNSANQWDETYVMQDCFVLGSKYCKKVNGSFGVPLVCPLTVKMV